MSNKKRFKISTVKSRLYFALNTSGKMHYFLFRVDFSSFEALGAMLMVKLYKGREILKEDQSPLATSYTLKEIENYGITICAGVLGAYLNLHFFPISKTIRKNF